MAIPKIKATYSLDADTMRVLERTAKRWGISKSEALRRAIRALDRTAGKSEPESALDDLQAAAALTAAAANRWVKDVRADRRSSRIESTQRQKCFSSTPAFSSRRSSPVRPRTSSSGSGFGAAKR